MWEGFVYIRCNDLYICMWNFQNTGVVVTSLAFGARAISTILVSACWVGTTPKEYVQKSQSPAYVGYKELYGPSCSHNKH